MAVKKETPVVEEKLPTESEIKEALKGVDLTAGEPEIVINKEHDLVKAITAEVKAELQEAQEEKVTMTRTELKTLIKEAVTSSNHVIAPVIPVVNKVTTPNSPKLEDSKQKALHAILAYQKKQAQ